VSTRAEAAKLLAPIIRQEKSLQSVFERVISALPDKEKPFFHTVVYGCLRHYHELAIISEQLLDKKLKNKDADIYALILLGLYQLRHMRTPDHAALSESVEAVKPLKKPWAAKLINGVLRNYLRDQETLQKKLAPRQEFLFSHPYWIIAQLKNDWPQDWAEILQANNQQAAIFLRVNRRRQSRDEYLTKLDDSVKVNVKESLNDNLNEVSNVSLNKNFIPSLHSQDGILSTQSCQITQLPGFNEGDVSVQDEAAQLAAQLLDLAPGQRVLDACAAPGGKTAHILERESRLAEVVAIDFDGERNTRTAENLARLNLTATIKNSDAADLDSWWDGVPFDRILLDAPCSASGVIRKHPDIKLLRREGDLATLVLLQAKLLEQLWTCLKPGGLIVYATCSVFKCENEEQIKNFIGLQNSTDVEHEVINASWGHERPYGRQLFPVKNGHDGFYYACLRKLSVV
jgi:16S rRNA (cytosine967-C5)-methyltransferase